MCHATFLTEGGMLALGDKVACALSFPLICSSFNSESEGKLAAFQNALKTLRAERISA